MRGTILVRCGECEAEVDERSDLEVVERTPCRSCGSVSRAFDIERTATISPRATFALKARSAGDRRPFLEQRVGDEL